MSASRHFLCSDLVPGAKTNRSWRVRDFREDAEAFVEIEKERDILCLAPQYHTAGFCYCHVWCDICGNEVWIKTMREIDVLLVEESIIIDGRMVQLHHRTLHVCIECLTMLKQVLDEKAIPDVKEPEEDF